MAWTPVLLMTMASHIPLLVVSQFLLGSFNPSQSMVWLFLASWSVIAERCTSETESFLARVTFTFKDLTSCCSVSLTPYLYISRVYKQGWTPLNMLLVLVIVTLVLLLTLDIMPHSAGVVLKAMRFWDCISVDNWKSSMRESHVLLGVGCCHP